jgi:hypothetical protein
MNPDTQLLLAEIQKLAVAQTETQKQLADQGALLERRFLEADEVLEQRFKDAESAVEQRIIDSELRQDTRLVNIEKAAGDLQSWRQEQEGVIDDLRLRLTKLDKYWNRSIADNVTEPALFNEPPVKLEQHAATSSTGYMAARPNGRRIDNHHREDGYGVVTTLAHSPVTGMANSTDPPDPPPKLHGTAADLIQAHNRPSDLPPNSTGKLPKMNFPSFDGTDLQYWITCAEDYFHIYSVDPAVWIQCSRMQFIGPAKRWIQSVTPQLKTMHWSTFCRALRNRFDRD